MSTLISISEGNPSCAGLDLNMFFPTNEIYDDEEGDSYLAVEVYPMLRKMCDECPVLGKCSSWSLRHEMYGFWAGTTPKERKKLRVKHRIPYSEPTY